MANFRQFNKNFSRDIQRAIDKAIDASTLNETGRYLANQIKIRTRQGRGVENSEDRTTYRLKPLSSSYVAQRRRLRRLGLLSRSTSAARSNLTRTGEMLDSIDFTTNNREKSIYLDFSNRASQQKAEYVSNDRPFFNLSQGDINEVTRRWNEKIANELVRVNFRN